MSVSGGNLIREYREICIQWCSAVFAHYCWELHFSTVNPFKLDKYFWCSQTCHTSQQTTTSFMYRNRQVMNIFVDRNSSQWSTKNTSAHHPLRLEEYIYSAHTIQHLIIKQTWVLCNNYYICLKIKFLQYIFMIFRNNFYRYLNIIYRYVPAKCQ